MSFTTFFAHSAMHQLGHVLEPASEGLATLTNYVAPIERIPAEKVMELGIKGWIPEEAVECLARVQGVPLNLVGGPCAVDTTGAKGALTRMWNKVYYAHQEQPATAEFREIANRQLLDDQAVEDQMRLVGFYTAQNQQWMTNLRYDIPGPADLVRFSVRHCWEPDLLEHFGYADEFPGAIIDAWHRFKGLDYPLFTGPFREQIETLMGGPAPYQEIVDAYAKRGLGDPTWAQFYWYSHWVLPSPTQGYLMWQRLNPDRDHRWDGPEMENLDFTFGDLQLLLRANDYPPFYRNLLAAISRPIPGIRFARDFRAQGVYNINDLYGWALRQGYSPGDAEAIARDIDTAQQKKDDKPAACKGCKEAEGLYEIGVIDRGELVDFYESQGMTVEQANQHADLEDVHLKGIRARQVVSTVRKRYLSGELDDQAASGLLTQFGLVQPRIAGYLSDWGLEKGTARKQVSAQRAQRWACQGLITVDDLSARLANLGYAQADIDNLVAEARICQVELQAKAAAAAAKAEAQRIKQLQQAQKAAAAQLTQARKSLAAHGTPAQLRKWFCEGHIGEPELYGRLRFLGWPDIDIGRLIGDCSSGVSPGQPPPSGGGGGKQPPGGGQ